ncbi:hypothetical protein L210DRAFT_3644684 [Boletus edulis BED1]|uniref:Uncharacterized protein n=1 Tax=Boletus edulis BED1 TaxID=1328754 RepID=A0AAD4BWM5_BOLED|nr:hypothetical protein L210DRAFT_3644684 [Boletus edulis BED1]
MAISPQDVYARNLLSHHGYPLRTPEPNIELPDSYRREGLKIGDIGVVVPEEGSFDVFFNITLPREHPLHAADGVPDSFTQIELRREDYRIAPEAECPGRVISPSTVECAVNCVDPFYVDGAARRLTDHQFSLLHNEGAMLILPQGAERHRLAKDLLLLDAILQNAVDWYRFAREKLYRDISNDALYLITGFHKAHSWSLASFKNTRASSAQCKIVQLRRAGSMISDDCTWETTHPLEWRIGPRHLAELPNQSVFIVGFKIAVNKELLYMQRVTVKAGHSKRALATTLVGFGSSLANLLPWAASKVIYAPEAATQYEEDNEPTLERDPSEGQPEGGVKVERVPQLSQARLSFSY